MEDYRVKLDVYDGPLDLLLYLIRRDEIDIANIPITRILEQYTRYVEALQQIDSELAGEFLVMAATLVEIKTRMLLPNPPAEEGQSFAEGIDPRSELVRQLLQYKAYKDASAELAAAADLQSMKFPHRPTQIEPPAPEYDLEDAQVWDLLDAFSKLMASIGSQAKQHEVLYDETPVELHAADIVDRLQREGALTFGQVFEGRTQRREIIGLFLALLELVRQKKVSALQDTNFGEILITLKQESIEGSYVSTDEQAASAEPEIQQTPAGVAPASDAMPMVSEPAAYPDAEGEEPL